MSKCLVLVAVFCLFFTSQEINIKRSPNTAKLLGEFLWTRTPRMGQSSTWGVPRGGTTHQGAPGPPSAPKLVVPTSMASRTPSSPYKFPKYSKNPRGEPRSEVPPLQGSVATRNQSRPRSGTLPEGGIISGGHLHHPRGHQDEEGVVHPRG